MTYETVKYKAILVETPKATKFIFWDDSEHWIPKSQIEIYEDEKEVNMPLWLYEKTFGLPTPEDITRKALK